MNQEFKTTSLYDEAAFGHEAAKALKSAYNAKDEWYRMGWNNAIQMMANHADARGEPIQEILKMKK